MYSGTVHRRCHTQASRKANFPTNYVAVDTLPLMAGNSISGTEAECELASKSGDDAWYLVCTPSTVRSVDISHGDRADSPHIVLLSIDMHSLWPMTLDTVILLHCCNLPTMSCVSAISRLAPELFRLGMATRVMGHRLPDD